MARAGYLKKVVSFQRLDEDADEYGNTTEGTYATFLTVRGGFRPERVRETLEAGRLQDGVRGALMVRGSRRARTVVAADRVLIDGEPYAIVSDAINPDQRGRYLEFQVERNVAT